MSDNEVFNVNGEDRDLLEEVIRLRFVQYAGRKNNAPLFTGYKINKDKGMILSIYTDQDFQAFPFKGFTAQIDFIWAWLSSEDALEITCEGVDGNAEHDGHNGRGWRAYVDHWGDDNEPHDGFLAVKPVWLWFGK